MENIENKIKTAPKDFCLYRVNDSALRQRGEPFESAV